MKKRQSEEERLIAWSLSQRRPVDELFRKIGERHVDRDQDRQQLIGERIKNVATAIFAVAVLFGVAEVRTELRTMQSEYYDKHPIRSDDTNPVNLADKNKACPHCHVIGLALPALAFLNSLLA